MLFWWRSLWRRLALVQRRKAIFIWLFGHANYLVPPVGGGWSPISSETARRATSYKTIGSIIWSPRDYQQQIHTPGLIAGRHIVAFICYLTRKTCASKHQNAHVAEWKCMIFKPKVRPCLFIFLYRDRTLWEFLKKEVWKFKILGHFFI